MMHSTHSSPSDSLPWNLAADGYADVLMPWFSSYAADALAWSGISAPAAVLDVASGPGTLSLLAAERGLRVTAIDLAERMVVSLHQGAESRGVDGVAAVRADGEWLPFADGTFEAGFSMFGIIFFPSPPRGLREMLRVLRPGGLTVIATWQPLAATPLLVELIEAIQAEDESFSFLEDELSLPGELENAMTETGFTGVTTREVTHSLECDSLAQTLDRLAESTLPFIVLRQRLSAEDWNRVWTRAQGRLARRFGEGPQSLHYPAWLAAGWKPSA